MNMHNFQQALLYLFLVLGAFFLVKHDMQQGQSQPDTFSRKYNSAREDWYRHEGPGLFLRYHREIRTREGEGFPRYGTNYTHREWAKALRHRRSAGKRGQALNWQERGPGNVGGRTRSLWVDPRDSSHRSWYVGSVGGGVWKTTDAGQSWRHLTEELPNLATSALAGAASNPLVLYAGTGEGFRNADIMGSGIWKSTDGGESWSSLPATSQDIRFANVYRLAVNPTNEQEVFAATIKGRQRNPPPGEDISFIFRSQDGGQSWEAVYSSPNQIQQVLYHPDSLHILYATINGSGIIRSTDGGRRWHPIFEQANRPENMGRIEMAIAPSNPQYLYFSAESSDGSLLFMSFDGGNSWGRVAPIDEANAFGNWMGGQGWWDNAIGVHPYNPLQVFVGGAGPILQINILDTFRDQVVFDSLRSTAAYLDLSFNQGNSILTTRAAAEIFWAATPPAITPSESYRPVEIRFGPGNSQRAHVHRIDSSTNPAFSNTYRGMATVPFSVWDLEENRQLGVSFLDENGDGGWSLPDSGSGLPEPIFIHYLDYNPLPEGRIIDEGLFSAGLYAVYAWLEPQSEVNPQELPAGSLRIYARPLPGIRAAMLPIADGYAAYRDQFPQASTKGVHVDHHSLTLIGTDSSTQQFMLLNTNDGGVAFSADGGHTFVQTGDTFKEREEGESFPTNKGYNTSQFYGVDKMNGGDRYVGGTQDNGSWVSGYEPDAASEWALAPSGDGFEAAWHYLDTNKIIETSQFNVTFRSLDGGQSWQNISPPESGPFISQIANSKQDPELVFMVSRQGLFRSTDFGSEWNLIPLSSPWQYNGGRTPVSISLADPLTVWTGTGLSASSRLMVSVDGGNSFTIVNPYSQAQLGLITEICTHPTNPRSAFALFSMADGPKILRTRDLGQSWEDLSGFNGNAENSSNGFPDVATYSLLVMPFDTNRIWAGTEIGLFESLDGGQSWLYADNGLPPVSIWEMKIVNDEVVLATHGRGIWTASLPELAGYEPIRPQALLPALHPQPLAFDGLISGTYELRSPYDSSRLSVDIELDGQVSTLAAFDFSANEAAETRSLDIFVEGLPPDTILAAVLNLRAFTGGRELHISREVLIFDAADEVLSRFESDFEQTTRIDFARLGFNIQVDAGFSRPGLHSLHPYPGNNTTLMSMLRHPIVVHAEGSRLTYRDVALIEPGEDSSAFGSIEFYDYVTLEATADRGKSWTTLTGYDSRYSDKWLEAYTDELPVDSSLLEVHQVNLLEHFEAGDTLFLRFRLQSDPLVEGWGWMIDELVVEKTVDVPPAAKPGLWLRAYPNPFHESIKLEYELPQAAVVSLQVFALSGQRVAVLPPAFKAAGRHQLQLDMGKLPDGLYLCRFEAGGVVKQLKWLKRGQ